MHLELLYCPFGVENGFTNPFASDFSMTSLESVLKNRANGTEATESEQAVAQKRKEVIIRGVLSVTVLSAEDLPATDLVGKSDPYVVLTMKKSGMKNKTRVRLICLKLRSFVFVTYGFKSLCWHFHSPYVILNLKLPPLLL